MTSENDHMFNGEPDRFLKRFVVITIILVSSVIALAVIFAVIFLPAFGVSQAPEELKNWGGLIIGFYFGTFLGLLKDWLSVPLPSTNPTIAQQPKKSIESPVAPVDDNLTKNPI